MCFKKTINFKTNNLKRNQKPVIGYSNVWL